MYILNIKPVKIDDIFFTFFLVSRQLNISNSKKKEPIVWQILLYHVCKLLKKKKWLQKFLNWSLYSLFSNIHRIIQYSRTAEIEFSI